MHDHFWGHVDALRRSLLQAMAIIILATCVALFFYQNIFNLFTRPYRESLTQGFEQVEIRHLELSNSSAQVKTYQLQANQELLSPSTTIAPGGKIILREKKSLGGLAVFGPVEGMLIALKVCCWCGIALSSPLWLYALLRFIIPALHSAEKLLILPFLLCSASFIMAGLAFAYFITIPLSNSYLMSFNDTLGSNFWSLKSYLDYSLFLLLANAFAFELGLILLFLVHCGILSAEFLASKRRHMVVVAFVLGAILTPPDVLTQLMLAIPLILLYEIALLYAKFRAAYVRGLNPLCHVPRGTDATHPQAS